MKVSKTLSFFLVLSLALVNLSFAGRPHLIPKQNKHRDSSQRPVEGRIGACQLSAQLLLGDDHTATLNVSAPAPGRITKLQIKRAGQTENQNHLNDASVSLTYHGVARGESFEVFGHIKGCDGKRTTVVRLSVPVTLSPDLRVVSFDAPGTARSNTPVFFKATIAEVNGDMGADANVILKVDGAEVDRAAIWVDSNSSSDVTLMHTFASAGLKSLQIVIADVTPAELDDSNNSASAQIEVSADSQFLSYTATASQFESYDFYHEFTATSDTVSEQTFVFSSVQMLGSIGPLDFSTASIQLDEFTGASHLSASFDLSPGASGSCFLSSVNGRTLYVCRVDDQLTDFQMFRESSEVTFYSGSWANEFAGGPGDYYSIGATNENIRFGSQYEIKVRISSATELYEANPIIDLQTTVEVLADQPVTCADGLCFEFRSIATTTAGSVSGPLQ